MARYEVFVPDGSGQMAQQLLTLQEIRSLLARQSLGVDDQHSAGTTGDSDSAHLYYNHYHHHHHQQHLHNQQENGHPLLASRASDAQDVQLISQLAADVATATPPTPTPSIPVSQLSATAINRTAVSDVISSVMT